MEGNFLYQSQKSMSYQWKFLNTLIATKILNSKNFYQKKFVIRIKFYFRKNLYIIELFI